MISFDVYDTCLVRTFAEPSDLYLLLAENLLRGREGGADREMITELAYLRTDAHRTAERLSGREEVGLEEIYQCLNLDDWPISTEEMMDEEIRLEVESVRPVARIKNEIEIHRRTGESITFISDTPLPRGHLRAVLERWGLATPGDRIYTSSDVGFRKSSGLLFQYVREQEGVSVGDWVHRGDHPLADESAPRRLGIRTEPFLDSQLNRYETMVLNDGYGNRSVRSRIAGVSRATRLMSEADVVRFPGLASMVANVVAPLLTCFVAWLLQDARRNGVDRLYFVSRDGEMLLQIADQLKQHIPAPECRYLYGSRQAWLLAATTMVKRDDLAWIFNDSVTPRDLLGKLGLRPHEVSDALHTQGFDEVALSRPLGLADIERFWQVLEELDVTDLILQRIASARQDSLDYFRQEGLTDGGKWALVDVGWKLQSQWALRRMLDTIEMEESVNGYYLGVARRRRRMTETGPYRALFIPEEFDEAQTLHEHAVLIEHAFLPASHGPVLGYRREGERIMPLLRPEEPPHDWRLYQSSVSRLVLRYADEVARAGILDADLDQLTWSALRTAHRFLTDPTREEVDTLGWMTASDDPFHHPDQHRPLVKPYGLEEVVGRLADRGRSILGNREGRSWGDKPHWAHGSRAISKPWVVRLHRLASSRASSWLRQRWRRE